MLSSLSHVASLRSAREEARSGANAHNPTSETCGAPHRQPFGDPLSLVGPVLREGTELLDESLTAHRDPEPFRKEKRHPSRTLESSFRGGAYVHSPFKGGIFPQRVFSCHPEEEFSSRFRRKGNPSTEVSRHDSDFPRRRQGSKNAPVEKPTVSVPGPFLGDCPLGAPPTRSGADKKPFPDPLGETRPEEPVRFWEGVNRGALFVHAGEPSFLPEQEMAGEVGFLPQGDALREVLKRITLSSETFSQAISSLILPFEELNDGGWLSEVGETGLSVGSRRIRRERQAQGIWLDAPL